MIIRRIKPNESEKFNSVIKHPIQTWEWGDFKQKVGMTPIRLGIFDNGKLKKGYQILAKPIPKTPYNVAHCLKSDIPEKEVLNAFQDLMQEENIIFIQLEPDVIKKRWSNKKGELSEKAKKYKIPNIEKDNIKEAKKPFFDQYSFFIDLEKDEEEIMMNMHRKTRYNVRLAKRKGVEIIEQSNEEGLSIFTKLLNETLERQDFYLHSPDYFKKMWSIMKKTNIPHILLAKYKEKVLAAWMLFIWDNRLFYPYGASSNEHRDVMASNLICWEAIKFGKGKGCKSFDMWGAGQGPNPDKDHPWYGFYRFKRGYGADLVEFAGSFDYINNPLFYEGVQFANIIRWKILRLKKKLLYLLSCL